MLHKALRNLPLWLAAGWLMSLSMLGFVVVPMLFAKLPSPALAGNMAGQLFSVQTVISAVCGAGLAAICSGMVPGGSSDRRGLILGLVGAALAVFVELVVSPHIVARDNLRFWHGLGSSLYLVQWGAALWSFARLTDRFSKA